MAARSVALNQKWAAEAHSARCASNAKRNFGAYAPVGEMWKKQTRNACVFPIRGIIAHTLLRWCKPDGSVVPFDLGYEGDTLMAPIWAIKA
jgi:hypothetical protein